MQVNFDCNCPKPQFGRFLRVRSIDVPSFVSYTKVEGYSEGIAREKALRKLLTSQNKNKNYDLRYDANSDGIELIRCSDRSVIRTFKNTGRTKLEAMGNGFWARFRAAFDKRLLLPENLYNAVERASSLDKKVKAGKI